MRILYLFCCFAIVILGCSVNMTNENTPGNGKTISGNGIVVYKNVEGGFYGIVSDDGNKYLPQNLKSDFPDLTEDSIRVSFEGKTLEKQVNFHMWGVPLKLTNINKNQHH